MPAQLDGLFTGVVFAEVIAKRSACWCCVFVPVRNVARADDFEFVGGEEFFYLASVSSAARAVEVGLTLGEESRLVMDAIFSRSLSRWAVWSVEGDFSVGHADWQTSGFG